MRPVRLFCLSLNDLMLGRFSGLEDVSDSFSAFVTLKDVRRCIAPLWRRGLKAAVATLKCRLETRAEAAVWCVFVANHKANNPRQSDR